MDELHRNLEDRVRRQESACRERLKAIHQKPSYRSRILQGALIAFLGGMAVYSLYDKNDETDHSSISVETSDRRHENLQYLGFSRYMKRADSLAYQLQKNPDTEIKKAYIETIRTLEILEQHKQDQAQKLGVAPMIREFIETHYKNELLSSILSKED